MRMSSIFFEKATAKLYYWRIAKMGISSFFLSKGNGSIQYCYYSIDNLLGNYGIISYILLLNSNIATFYTKMMVLSLNIYQLL
jgi:hypothetical protein